MRCGVACVLLALALCCSLLGASAAEKEEVVQVEAACADVNVSRWRPIGKDLWYNCSESSSGLNAMICKMGDGNCQGKGFESDAVFTINISFIDPTTMEKWWQKNVGKDTRSSVAVSPTLSEGSSQSVVPGQKNAESPASPSTMTTQSGSGATERGNNALQSKASGDNEAGTEHNGGSEGTRAGEAATGGGDADAPSEEEGQVVKSQSGPQVPSKGEVARPREATPTLPSGAEAATPGVETPPIEDSAGGDSPGLPQAPETPRPPGVAGGGVDAEKKLIPAAAPSNTTHSSTHRRIAGEADGSDVITAWARTPLSLLLLLLLTFVSALV
ncbi:90 kDa surface protein [Trypanosoma rangeli]|uniref:90 kDa surface protein n=1 Tax=Trypanosoma rangeli TaxID=5698 RepID=A0A3R7RDC4_TRYRA|nr:90 kDa surface protein [Trypanosoma rangeli]RNF00298.1 90 kDa surface protein [Trypanosoma rangeli]|eukprot:RNF00298.1 90 kDa surface protein [Trypanosoma rangeli]